MPFTFEKLDIPDVVLIRPRVHGDDQLLPGNVQTLRVQGPGIRNSSCRSTIRGRQPGCFGACTTRKTPGPRGSAQRRPWRIFDVAVDIRVGSPTYGTWVGAILSDANHHLLYVPPGFAHGFCVVEGPADLIYQVTEEYSVEHDRGILWNDPAIGVAWPVTSPELSTRDAVQPLLSGRTTTSSSGPIADGPFLQQLGRRRRETPAGICTDGVPIRRSRACPMTPPSLSQARTITATRAAVSPTVPGIVWALLHSPASSSHIPAPSSHRLHASGAKAGRTRQADPGPPAPGSKQSRHSPVHRWVGLGPVGEIPVIML